MNIEGAKENIQPLAAGRNIERLEVALNAESHPESQQELLLQRRQFEQSIFDYVGDDPLDLWFEYVSWVEQSYPKSGKESALDDLLKKCLSTFEKDDRYRQDQRFIRLFIKYIDTKKNPNQYYTKLYNGGVGTMVADLYIAWAHYYDIVDNFEQAEQVYQKGLDARAAPIDQLKQAHEKFQFSISQRILRKDAYRQEFLSSMEERRNAFTSLRSLKSSKVGSIRTGSAVKSNIPGQVRQSHSTTSSNMPLMVYEGYSENNFKTEPQLSTSVVQDIQNSMLENNVEPGPWSKASSRKSVFHNVPDRKSTLKFAILEDADTYEPKIKFGPLPPDDGKNVFNRFPDFPRKNQIQKPFDVPSYVEDSIPPNQLSCYDIFFLHPNKDVSFCPDELRAYKLFKSKNISNDLTRAQDKIWLTSPSVPMRLPKIFARQNIPSIEFTTERPDIFSIAPETQFSCKLSELYPEDSTEEFSFDELMREKWMSKVEKEEIMDETVCVKGRQSFGVKHTRKSIATGGRKSIMPVINDRGSSYAPRPSMLVPSSNANANSDVEMDLDDGFEDAVQNEPKQSDQTNTGVKLCQQNKYEEHAGSTEHNNESKKTQVSSAPFVIFNDEEAQRTPSLFSARNDLVEVGVESAKKKETLPSVGGWSIFTDDEPKGISPTIFTSKSMRPSDDTDRNKEVFAVPQYKPLVESSTLAEKRTLGTAMRGIDVQSEATEVKRKLVDRSPYPIEPHTGAIKKTIRKSSITENAIQFNQNKGNSPAITPLSNDEFKCPDPVFDQAKTIRHENTDFDFSLCTQNFNFNLQDQMVSTPVAIRRTEPLTEQVGTQPLKLSTIMETTEGSAHTASSTKSSTQFSSPEDEDQSKRSNLMNRTKFAEVPVSPDSDLSDTNKDDLKTDCAEQKNVANFTNYTLPAVQMSLLPKNVSTSTNSIAVTLPAKELPSKYPFPIFEDSQTITTSPATLQAKSMPLESGLQKTIPLESTLPAQHLSGDPFNLTSICIKDEPQSYLSDGATITESFAIPNIVQIESLAQYQPNHTNILEPEKQYQCEETAQDEMGTQELTITENEIAENARSKLDLRKASTFSQTKDMSKMNFELNDSCSSEEEIIEVPDETVIVDENAEEQSFLLGDAASGESFAIPNVVKIVAESTQTEPQPKDIVVSQDEEPNITLPRLKTRDTIAIDSRISISMAEHEKKAYARCRHAVGDSPLISGNINSMGLTKNDNSDSDSEIIVVDDDSFVEPKGSNVTFAEGKGFDDTFVDVRFDEKCDQSIYYKHNSILIEPTWSDDITEKVIPGDDNLYEHEKVNLEESVIIIKSKLAEPNLNPFSESLKTALLHKLSFIDLLETNESTELVKNVPFISSRAPIKLRDIYFDVTSCIGNGAYGRVYNVKREDGRTFAVKKEKPANLWEYYILTEVQKRIDANLLQGFMKIDYAIIGNDGSLLFSEFSPYGSLLDVCNRVFSSLQQHVGESVTFILAIQMLELIDHLHKNGILHLDLKPDNFLVMQQMSSDYNKLVIQLIDFGNAVDLQQFPTGQKFRAAVETKHFVCIEMVNNRPWIFQPDLYCLAGTIHSVLFGKYMQVEEKGLAYEITTKIPRYFNKTVWNSFFDKLINVNEQSLPNLQEIRKSLCDAVEEIKQDKLEERVKVFNNFMVDNRSMIRKKSNFKF